MRRRCIEIEGRPEGLEEGVSGEVGSAAARSRAVAYTSLSLGSSGGCIYPILDIVVVDHVVIVTITKSLHLFLLLLIKYLACY